MIYRLTAEQIEEKLGAFFGKIGKFFIDIFNTILEAFDKFLPREITIILFVAVGAFLIIYIFTQKINK